MTPNNQHIKIKLVFILLSYSFLGFGQWNIQAGYDLGYFTRHYDRQSPLNSLHRLNIVNEYIFKNNISVSLNTGIDFHYFNYSFQRTMNYTTGNTSYNEIYYDKINIQNYRLGFSLGYQFNLNNKSRVLFEVSYDQYFVNNVSIKDSYKITNRYDVPVNQIDDNEPAITIKEFDPHINLNFIGYRNKLLKENRNIIFSAQYRYQYEKYFIAPSIGFSAWNKGALGRSGRNILFIGLNFGYTLPQKNKSNEK